MIASLVLAIGLASAKTRGDVPAAALAILGPLWIGWPALTQGASTTVLLALPIVVGLWGLGAAKTSKAVTADLCLLLIIMAIGLALIALFARTVSITQQSLALASILGAIMLLGPRPPLPILLMAGATMLSGLLSALLLYSAASLPAMLILSSLVIARSLFSVLFAHDTDRSKLSLTLPIAAALAAIAVSVAWIDAGTISVYEKAQMPG